MELYIGMDVDPSALEIGQGHIEAFLTKREANRAEGNALQGTLRALHSRQELQVHQSSSW
jgi:16S rRNA (cytosine1402-N4)-methyltransferase